MKSVVSILGTLLFLSSCNYRLVKNPKQFNSSPSYQTIREQIFKPSCLRCHSGDDAAMGVDLSNYSTIINSGLEVVIPKEPLNSTLYLNVQSGRMPPDGPRLSDAEIKIIFDWISAGAREN